MSGIAPRAQPLAQPIVACGLLFVLACSGAEQEIFARSDGGVSQEPARARASLVDPSAWQVMAAVDDPFADRPEDPSCADGSFVPEWLADEAVFSVDTGGCSYLTARQSTLRQVAAGESLALRVWHFALTAGESAVAHVAVQLGDELLLDQSVAIPSKGGLLSLEQVAPSAVPAGTPVYFHLHNHGDNSWSFVELSAGPPQP
jgi:hypothetical protein